MYMFDVVLARSEGNYLSNYDQWLRGIEEGLESVFELVEDDSSTLSKFNVNGKGPFILHKRFFKPIHLDEIPLENWL